MKPGDPIKCPHCGADSFLKKESVMDGWTKVGEVLKCVSCSAVIKDCSKQEVFFAVLRIRQSVISF